MTAFGRSAREQLEFEKAHYPGTEILRNKLGLRDHEDLEIAERLFWAKRAAQGMPKSARKLNVDGLRAIHRHHLQDVYDWAGQFRGYTTGRGPAPFATPENIAPWLERQFVELRREKLLQGLDADSFAIRAAHYVNEINAAHPFIEGNGRTQRVWLRNLAHQAGFRIHLQPNDQVPWNNASRIGFERSDASPMAHLIRSRIVDA